MRRWERSRQRLTGALARVMPRDPVLSDQVGQRLLYLEYQRLAPERLPGLDVAGFRVFSNADEDGILVYVFALVGMRSRVVVEIAFGSPDGANATNLICNWGWSGVLVEGDPDLAASARAFFAGHRDTYVHPPVVVSDHVTVDNVNRLLADAGVSGEIDLLSIDLDGIDYWVWKALEVVRPRVVVVEFQNILGAQRSVTVPYRPDFVRAASGPARDFFGASLAAFVSLGRAKGYRLVGANRYGYNAFFVADGVGEDVLVEVDPASCLREPKQSWDERHRLPAVADMAWQQV